LKRIAVSINYYAISLYDDRIVDVRSKNVSDIVSSLDIRRSFYASIRPNVNGTRCFDWLNVKRQRQHAGKQKNEHN
jgi:hypothetical protein